ncbi:TrkH family potassium uptake protein [Rhodoferax sp.]|uniref:TrkH family potassium uptake protein n=1 Tax=Rhodoferax sp. TaxID=50421 RepID=UPI003BB7C646
MKIDTLHSSTILVLSFLTVILLGTGLLMLPLSHAKGEVTPFLTALFTSTSAVCVTGLVVVDTGTYWSGAGQGIIMALFQLGGFGMMTSATLMGLLVSGSIRLRTQRLLQAETHSLALGDVKSVVKVVFWVTVLTELVLAAVLTLRFGLGYGMPWTEALWHGLFHSVSAFNNAGFSTWSDSVMRYVGDAYVLVPLMLAIVIGGLGFPVLQELMVERGQRKPKWSMHAVLTIWGSIALILGGALIIFVTEMDNPKTLGPMAWATKGLAAMFTSVSARTAGFNAVDIGGLTNESLALHFALMFIGGGSAGTAGGIKVTTFFVLVLVVWSEIRGNPDVEFRGRRIAEPVQRQALTVVALGSATITLAMLLILPMTTLPYEKVLFEVISAFATVGLSTGITAELAPGAQFILIALMFIGRVGVVTLAVAIATNQSRRNYRYPEEKPIVG